jgi:hypothetical protein
MGIARPKDLADLARLDANLKVTCRDCGRSAVYELLPILNHFRGRGWNTAWSTIGRRFRCAGTAESPGCGSRDMAVGMVPLDRPPPPEPKLTETQLRQRARRKRH